MSNAEISSIVPIVVTPFGEGGEINHVAMGAQLDFLADLGIAWVGIGYGSEVQRLARTELDELASRAVQHAAGRLQFVGNVELTSYESAVTDIASAATAGLHMAMVRPVAFPGVSHAGHAGLISRIAKSTTIPLIVQDAVQHTGIDLSPDVLAGLLAQHHMIASVKVEPPGAATKMSAIVDAMPLGAMPRILGGAQGIGYLQELARGANGTMPGPAFPELFRAVEVLNACGDRAAAFELLGRATPLITLGGRNMETFIFVQKYLLVRRGVLTSTALRGPHRELDTLLVAEIEELLAALSFDELLEECRRITT